MTQSKLKDDFFLLHYTVNYFLYIFLNTKKNPINEIKKKHNLNFQLVIWRKKC